MRWYGWIAVLFSWMITSALLIATISQLLPPSSPDSSPPNVADAAAGADNTP